MTLGKLYKNIVHDLQLIYPESEAKALALSLLEHFGKLPRTHLYAFPEIQITNDIVGKIQAAAKQLLAHKPLQYITGETLFCGFPITVNKAVLIPRPETEELVHWAAKDLQAASNPIIVDLCTGSGCIAIALKKLIPQATLFACDISPEALNVAEHNAKINDTVIHFFQCNILSEANFPFEQADCIISNPPYVRQSEKSAMSKNVLEYEPPGALFVSDSDPVIFYRAIADIAKKQLKKEGCLFVEINEAFGEETKALFAGNYTTELRKDINGKNRMIKIVNSER